MFLTLLSYSEAYFGQHIARLGERGQQFERVSAVLMLIFTGVTVVEPMSGRCMTAPSWTMVIYMGCTATGTLIVHLAMQSGTLTKIL
jgi:hypothetical protein